MVSPEIDNIRTPPYYVWTIVNTVIGNQSLLNDISTAYDCLAHISATAIDDKDHITLQTMHNWFSLIANCPPFQE